MTIWNAISPLVGVVCGALLTLLGQWLTDRRARRRDTERAKADATARREADWLLLQRRTLTEVQDTMEALWTKIAAFAAGAKDIGDPLALSGALIRLVTRLDDRETGEEIMRWFKEVREILLANPKELDRELVERGKAEHTRLQEKLGERLQALHAR